MSIEIPTKYIRTLYEYNGADLPVRNLEIYRYFIESKILGTRIRNTQLYKFYLNGVKENKDKVPIHGIKYSSDVLIRIDYLKDLFNDIKENGIKEPLELFIGSHGEYVIYEGHHRFAIANILGIKTVPSIVIREEKSWTDMKEQLQKEYDGKKLYNPIYHPDFVNWEILRGSERLEAISNRVGPLYGNLAGKFVRKRVLDIGCHMGFFSLELSKYGAEVTGIDGSQFYLDVANKMSHFYRMPVQFIQDDAWEYMKKDSNKYDFILCLSFLHHYSFDKVRELIGEMSKRTDIVFAEIGEEKKMKNGDLIRKFLDVKFSPTPICTGKDKRILYEFKKS